MKNSEKAVRVSRWNGPGIVKPIEAWNKIERTREDMAVVNKTSTNKKEAWYKQIYKMEFARSAGRLYKIKKT